MTGVVAPPRQSPVPDFGYLDAAGVCTVPYLAAIFERLLPRPTSPARCLDVGCGNGYWAGTLMGRGWGVVGLDPSANGIRIARETHPRGTFHQTIVSRDILAEIGERPFDAVLSTEVVEHLYDPRSWAAGCFAALKPGGLLVCTTPYHGYLKNIAVAITGKFDAHVSPLWDGGHIKFWSRATLNELLRDAGFTEMGFYGAGRLPYLWKSMVITAKRPG